MKQLAYIVGCIVAFIVFILWVLVELAKSHK
jgi:hypothetical protein